MDGSGFPSAAAEISTAHSVSMAATAAPTIVAPRHLDLADTTTSSTNSPAITTSGTGSAPPSVSPMAPSSSSSSSYQMNHVMGVLEMSVAKAKVTTKSQAGMNGGRWTEQEHQSFLAGLRLYGREWKKVASKIKTRTSAQIRSHAQKYFAKLTRDDEARKLGHGLSSPMMGPDGAVGAAASSSLYGYMSDDGSSTTAGNLSGDEGADTDSSTSHHHQHQHQQQQQQQQQHQHQQERLSLQQQQATPQQHQQRSLMHVHPFPSPTPHGVSSAASTLFASLLPSHKKRSRPTSDLLLSPSLPSTLSSSSSSSSSFSHAFKHRKTEAEASSLHRLPSAEELVEEVSPRVRQRLSSLIESEICALQVLSCYTWLQQQQQQQHQNELLKVQLQAPPPHRLVGVGGISNSSSGSSSSPATSAVFSSPASSSMGLAMFAAERSPSIF